jgi:hypothetical protein
MMDCNLETLESSLDSQENNYLEKLDCRCSGKQDYIVDCLASSSHSATLANNLEKLVNRQDLMGCNLD